MNNLTDIFSKNRIIALILLLICSILSWFSLILLTNPIKEKIKVDKMEYIGLGFAIFIGILTWIYKCLTIKPHKKN